MLFKHVAAVQNTTEMETLQGIIFLPSPWNIVLPVLLIRFEIPVVALYINYGFCSSIFFGCLFQYVCSISTLFVLVVKEQEDSSSFQTTLSTNSSRTLAGRKCTKLFPFSSSPYWNLFEQFSIFSSTGSATEANLNVVDVLSLKMYISNHGVTSSLLIIPIQPLCFEQPSTQDAQNWIYSQSTKILLDGHAEFRRSFLFRERTDTVLLFCEPDFHYTHRDKVGRNFHSSVCLRNLSFP